MWKWAEWMVMEDGAKKIDIKKRPHCERREYGRRKGQAVNNYFLSSMEA